MRPSRPCGVVIAARDEAASIGRCLEALREGLPAEFARVVIACNGCRDGTVSIARTWAGGDWTVLDIPEPGKARAIRAAERMLPPGPRFYIDADVVFRGVDLVRIAGTLGLGGLHLVSPSIRHDLDGCNLLSRSLNRTWLALPHARTHAFHHVLGVSEEGRGRWGEMPDVIGDDAFIASRFAPHERRVMPGVFVVTRPPRSLAAWIGVRKRWLAGDRELRSLGIADPDVPPQVRALLRRSLSPRTAADGLLYTGVRCVTAITAAVSRTRTTWYRDRTSRMAAASTPPLEHEDG